MAHIAIIGAGLGGVPCAYQLLLQQPGPAVIGAVAGAITPVYERYVLRALGIHSLKDIRP